MGAALHCCVLEHLAMMRTATLVMVVLAIAASEVAADKLDMPSMPPRADTIVHEKDPVAEALLADEENRHQDPTLNMLQDAMAQRKEFMPAYKKKALDAMDADIEQSRVMAKQMKKQILKNIEKRANKQKKRFEGVDRFNALRKNFFSFRTPEVQAQAAPQMVETGMKVKSVRHTKESPHHLAPVHYSPVPEGDDARKANADLASGADAARDEDWQVHKATYEKLHPSALEVNKAKEEKKEQKASPKPLKVAQKSFHHGLDTIQATKKIVRTPLTKLTFEEAKTQCAKVRDTADSKCKDDKHDTHIFCLTEGTEKTECDKHKMKDAAECNVAHETAMNKCYDLWKRAKANIAEARKKAAAPMDHTDTQVADMAAGSTKCAELMTKAQASCATAETTYKSECKSTMMQAIDMSVLQLKLGDEPTTGDKAASADASDSAEALKQAEETLTKQDASPELKDAIEKCDLKKNEYKRACISAVHEARDSCDSLTSASADDNAPTA